MMWGSMCDGYDLYENGIFVKSLVTYQYVSNLLILEKKLYEEFIFHDFFPVCKYSDLNQKNFYYAMLDRIPTCCVLSKFKNTH